MTTKRLNITFLAKLGIGSVLFLVGVYFLHGWQVKRNAAGLLKRADVARADGDLDESARLRMRYLSHVPDDAAQFKETAIDLKTSLMDKYENRQEITKLERDWAVRYVSDAVTFNGTDPEVRRLAAEFWFAFRQFKSAETNTEAIDRDDWTDDDLMRYINALRLQGGPKEEKAFAEFKTVLGYDRVTRNFVKQGTHPNLLPAYRSLVYLLLAKELDREAAVRVLDTMVERNPEDPQAYLARAQLIRTVRGGDGVEPSYADIETAYEKAPEDIEVIQAMSAMLLETDRAEDAKRLIELGLDQAEERSEKARLYLLLSQVYIRSSDTDGALKVLDRGNSEVPREPDLLLTKARLLLDQKRHGDVEAMYKVLKDAGHRDPTIGYLKARVLMDKDEFREAARGLSRIRDVLPSQMQYEAELYLSECYGRLGQYDKQLASVRSLLERAPDNEQLNGSYLQILLQLGRSGDAKAFIESRISTLQQAGKPVPKNLLVMLATLKLSDAALGAITLSPEEKAQLQKTIDDAKTDESLTDAQRQRLVIQQLRQTKDPAAAKAQLKGLIRNAPENYELWTQLIDFADDAEEAGKFFELMKTQVDNETYAAAMQMLKIQMAAKFDPDSLSAVLQDVENNLGQFAEHEQLTMLYRMGVVNLSLNRRDEGIRLLEKALTFDNASSSVKIEILNILFEDATSQNDAERIGQLIDRVRALVGNNDESYRILEARRIVWNIRNQVTSDEQRPEELRRARDLIQSIRSAREEWLPGILVEADLHLLDNNPRAAIRLLEVAHGFQPNNARVIRGIAMSYRALNDPAKAQEWIDRLPSTMRSQQDDRDELVTLWVRRAAWSSAEQDKAIQLIETAAPEDSTEIRDQLLRIQFFSYLEQLDKAELAGQRAKELAPENPDVWTSLINIYAIQKDNEKATAVLREAAEKLPEEVRLTTLGRCFAIVGDLQKAVQTFAAALDKDKENAYIKRLLAETLLKGNQGEPALKLMQSIVETSAKHASEGKQPTPQEFAATIWARRTLAGILARTNSYQNFLAALKLIEGNAVDGKLSPQDVMLFLGFCLQRPEKSSWDRALLELNKIAQQRPLSVDETFAKAALYEKYGDTYWADVKKMATDVLSINADDKKRVEAYIQWLLKRGEVREAVTWADRNLAASSVTRVRVGLHGDAQRGDFQRALQKLKSQNPKSLDTPEAKSQLLTLAGIADELGQYDDRFYKVAESMLRQLAQAAPQEILRVATLIGSRGDTAQVVESLQMCINASSSGITDVVAAQVAVSILRQHPEDWDGSLASSVQQVGQWLEQASSRDSENAMMQWRAAEFFDMIGDLDRAEVKYQAVLDSPNFSSPTDRGLVMNNLAYVMALNGKSTQPMQLIEEAEKLLPPSAEVTDTKGYIYLVNGETEKAISAFQQALNSGPKSGHKYFHLALAFDKIDNREKAKSTWEEALANDLVRSGLPPALRTEFDRLASKFGGIATRRAEAVTR